MKRILTILLALVLLTACGPTPTQSPDTPVHSDTPPSGLPPSYAPRPGDDLLRRENAYVDSVELLAMESFPVQYAVLLRGGMPTPCNELRAAIHEPDAENKIKLDVYSVVDPNVMCVEMIQPFQQNVYLGSFPAGHYTIWINGEMRAEFEG